MNKTLNNINWKEKNAGRFPTVVKKSEGCAADKMPSEMWPVAGEDLWDGSDQIIFSRFT